MASGDFLKTCVRMEPCEENMGRLEEEGSSFKTASCNRNRKMYLQVEGAESPERSLQDEMIHYVSQ